MVYWIADEPLSGGCFADRHPRRQSKDELTR